MLKFSRNKNLRLVVILAIVQFQQLSRLSPAYSQSNLANPSMVRTSTYQISQDFNLRVGEVNSYRLGVGDRIRIDILGSPEYGGEFLITPSGMLNLPWIQPINVINLTQQELAEKITREYAPILKRPFVTVILTEVRPVVVNVIGEVQYPGVYPVELDSGRGSQPRIQYPTIPQVLKAAGGVTLSANLREIQIHRSLPGNQKQVIPVNVLELLEKGQNIDSLILQDGDAVFVPPLDRINLAEVTQLASLNFAIPADQPRNITVLGEVQIPGDYVVIGGGSRSDLRPGGWPTVSWAIRSAGGITQKADLRHIEIYRPTHQGNSITFKVNLWDFVQGKDATQNTIVQEGDTIVIPALDEINYNEAIELGQTSLSPDKITVFVVGNKLDNISNITGEISVPLNTPMNQALLSADGFINRRVRQSSVDLVRFNRDGTASKREIMVDLAANVNPDTNPPLKDGDIIILSRSGLAKFIDFIGTVDQFMNLATPIRELINALEILGYIRNR